uniref:Uncharacterized protein n=1 Tax=Aquila chrysaetos chrysaetos TaxID=223781 RepID=A0A663ELF5_AQUCH
MASNSIFDSFATYSSAFLRGEYRPGSFVPRRQETSSAPSWIHHAGAQGK